MNTENRAWNLVILRKCVIHIICNIIKLVWASVSNYKELSFLYIQNSKKKIVLGSFYYIEIL